MKKINYKYTNIPKPLKVVEKNTDITKIWQLRQTEYGRYYPGMTDAAKDIYDDYSCILYTENDTGEIISTGRLVMDEEIGLPADKIIDREINLLRKRHGHIAELSRFAISNKVRGMLPVYLRTYHRIARENEIKSLVFITRDKNISFYQRVLDAQLICNDVGYTYGSKYHFSLLEWEIKSDLPMGLQ